MTSRSLTGSPRGSSRGCPGWRLPWWPPDRSLRPRDRDRWPRGSEYEPKKRGEGGGQKKDKRRTGGGEFSQPPVNFVMRSWHKERKERTPKKGIRNDDKGKGLIIAETKRCRLVKMKNKGKWVYQTSFSKMRKAHFSKLLCNWLM